MGREHISLQSVVLTASRVPFLKVQKLTREMISENDLKALLSAPPDTKIGRRDHMILILLYDLPSGFLNCYYLMSLL